MVASAAGVVAWTLSHASWCAAAQSWGQFSWRAPAGCPDRQLVLHELEAVLQEQTVGPSTTAVRGDITRSGPSWVLSLDVQVGSARRVRRLSAERCEDLGKAAAVALALLIRPLREQAAGSMPPSVAAGETSSEPRVMPPPPSREAEQGAELDLEEEPPADAWPISWRLGAHGVLDSSALAGPALGAGIESQLRLARWGFGAYGLVLPARRREVASAGSVEFALSAAGLRVCRALSEGAWRVDGCLGAELGRFTGRGSGLNLTRNEVRDLWLASFAGLHLGWHVLPHAALLGRVEAVVPVLQEDYVINGDDEVHDTPSVTFRASLGLEFDLL